MTNSLNSDSATGREFFERLLNTTTCEEWNEKDHKDKVVRQAVTELCQSLLAMENPIIMLSKLECI